MKRSLLLASLTATRGAPVIARPPQEIQKSAQDLANEFAHNNLSQCAAELIEWRTKGTLCDGKFRELAALCANFCSKDDELQVAELTVSTAALHAAAGDGKTVTS